MADRKTLVGNGGELENYSWVQTLQDVTVTVPVTPGMRATSPAMHVPGAAPLRSLYPAPTGQRPEHGALQ